jgi:hypothetical protein
MSAEIGAERPPGPSRQHEHQGASVDQSPSHRPDHSASATRPGEMARAAGRTLTSWRVAALPILDHILRRLRLQDVLRDHLPREDR